MHSVQMSDRSSGLIRHGSIDFLIPDVKMLDDFYRRRAISIGDIHNGLDGLPNTGTDHCAQAIPVSSPAKKVVIQQQIDNDVHSRYPSVISLESDEREPRCEDTTRRVCEPSMTVDGLDTVDTFNISDSFGKKDSFEENDVEAFFNNSSSTFAVEFGELYADIEAKTETKPSIETPDSRHDVQPDLFFRSTEIDSWSSFIADEHPSSFSWTNDTVDEDMATESGSVIVLEPQQLSGNDEQENESFLDLQDTKMLEPGPELSLHCTLPTKGFPGRFSMIQPNPHHFFSPPSTYTFGLTYHPNGRITNRRFLRDPHCAVASLDESEIMHDTLLSTAMQHAEITAARLEPLKQKRTLEERALRREIHRECALARLEGVSVGYYRYFAGHMTVEEYTAARVCVCWSECFCNKLCTRFGDMLCPCSEELELCD